MRKEEEERNAKERAIRQGLGNDHLCQTSFCYKFSVSELTSQQIDDLLHEFDSLDEDELKEMHENFIELW